jgi:hypothetical protein
VILKCYLLIDLKLGKLAHQDVGQMDSYVRLFDEQCRTEDDNPTIGLILCAEKNEAVARYSSCTSRAALRRQVCDLSAQRRRAAARAGA